LPQGAPTSGIVSNMVCEGMDAELSNLSQEFDCINTRYSDDLTISSVGNQFPEILAVVSRRGGKRVFLGSRLLSIVRRNGFRINPTKTRLLSKDDRQIVTGLVVNSFANVPRPYIKKIRGALHAWRRYGLDRASAAFCAKYSQGRSNIVCFERVIFGRIQHVGSVRGFNDQLYLKLRREFEDLLANERAPDWTAAS
jgi:RNA-directed DNA polymerase